MLMASTQLSCCVVRIESISDRPDKGGNMENKPLNGFRVLEFGGYISGPYASSLLNAMGAEVVKIEKPTGDEFRRQMNERSPYFIQYNAGKKSLAVDLKSPEGMEVVKSLVPKFDVVLENLRPGKLAALGLGPEACKKLNPQIVYTSVTGFGDDGPLRDRAAYDTIGQAFGGLYSLLSPQGNTALSGTILADLITGCMTTTGVLAALLGRAVTGRSSQVETSIMEAVSTITVDAMTQYFDTGLDPTLQSRHPQAQNFCVATASGENIAIHLSNSQQFWSRLCTAMERPELQDDPRFRNYLGREDNYLELAEVVKSAFCRRTFTDWEERLSRHDVPFAPVLTMSGYATHPQVAQLGIIGVPDQNTGTPLVRPPWRFDGVRPSRTGASPKIGEHTREIAREVISDDRLTDLINSGVLYAAL
jgi:crotonobetainyl-CoA:carnitine CoA-transferase CaiB-like acyl-CoA transferase